MEKFRLAVLVSGGGTNLQAVMDAIESGFLENTEICAVISSKENAYALERAVTFADKTGVEVDTAFIASKELPEKLLPLLKKYQPDLIVLAGFLAVVPDRVIDEYNGKIINIHPSLIPSFCGKGYYGLHVHQAVLDRGVKITGATVHEVDKGIDTGRILAQRAVAVLEGDTPEALQQRVMREAEHILLPQVIKEIYSKKFLL